MTWRTWIVLCGLAAVGTVARGTTPRPAVPASQHWEPIAGSPRVVADVLAALPDLKAAVVAEINDAIARAKQERSCVARAPLRSTDATGIRTLTGGTILRTDGSEEVRQRLRIKAYDDQIVALYARAKAILADPLWLPDRAAPPCQWQVGELGELVAAKVVQVIDGQNVVAEVEGVRFWLTGIDTSRMVDCQGVVFAQPGVWIEGTRRYTSQGDGATRTIFLVRPFDLREHLTAVNDSPPTRPAVGR